MPSICWWDPSESTADFGEAGWGQQSSTLSGIRRLLIETSLGCRIDWAVGERHHIPEFEHERAAYNNAGFAVSRTISGEELV